MPENPEPVPEQPPTPAPPDSKAEAKGDAWLADRIYSGVPAGMFGRKQEICVGYMSGASNVNYWLRQRRIEPSKELVDAQRGRPG